MAKNMKYVLQTEEAKHLYLQIKSPAGTTQRLDDFQLINSLRINKVSIHIYSLAVRKVING